LTSSIFPKSANNFIMAAALDSVKAVAQEKLGLLRTKLDQIPALQDVEVSLRLGWGDG
jgi:hypothetical protein